MPLSQPLWRIFKFKRKRPQPKLEFGRDFLLESKANSGVSLSSLPLPPEVWAEIFSNVVIVEQGAVARICLVCRAFYWEGVRLLYRRVDFEFTHSTAWRMQRWLVIVIARPRLAALVEALKVPFPDWTVKSQWEDRDRLYERWLDTIRSGFASLPNLKE
jgi:hypothetical protein